MKRISRVGMLGLVACMVLMAGSAAFAEASVDVPVLSSYVWRGMVLNDEMVLQPSLTASTAGFSFNAWSSMDLTDKNGAEGEFVEMDWTASYDYSFDMVSVGVGVVAYTFPNTTVEDEDGNGSAAAGTTEVYLSAGLDVLLAPSVTVYYDCDEIEGFYGLLSIGHSFEISDMVAVDVSASLSYADSEYNNGYFGYDDAALNDCLLGLAVPISPMEGLTITPSVSYMFLPDSDLSDAAEASYGEKDSVYGGVTLSYAF